MNDQPLQPVPPLQIKEPCRKSWAELSGGAARRFCSECRLHVHDAGHLTLSEAQALVAGAEARVCMRIQYDAGGAPIFRDTRPAQKPAARLARWALSAAAGILAACHGEVSTPAPVDPSAQPSAGEVPVPMGRVFTTEQLGGIDQTLIEPVERLGDVVAIPDPVSTPEPVE